MILLDLLNRLAGNQAAPAAPGGGDPMEAVKGGLLAQLLTAPAASALAAGGNAAPAAVKSTDADPLRPMVDGFAMPAAAQPTAPVAPAAPSPAPQPGGDPLGGLANVDPMAALNRGAGGLLSDLMDKWNGRTAPAPAPAPVVPMTLNQAPAQGPAATDQAPLAPAVVTPGQQWTDQAPVPNTGAQVPALGVKDIRAPAAPGVPYAPPKPDAAPVAPAANSDNTAPPTGKRFDVGFGDRLRAFGMALQGQDPGNPERMAEARNATMDFLISKGAAPDVARAFVLNPALLQQALPAMFQGRSLPKIEDIYDANGRKQKAIIDPNTGAYKTIGGASSGDEKPPSGFEWADPADHSKGLKAIAGGPATHMTAEMSGKLALMEASQKGINATKSVLLQPWGLVGAGQSLASKLPFVGDIATLSGDIGIASRNVRAGVEATLRVMTGAAAPEQEVQRYMQMFMPGVNDTKDSAQQKLDLLDQFMNNARELVTRGRTATPGPGGSGNQSPSVTGAQAAGPAPERATAVAEAKAAIAAGKNPDAVRARLAQWGYSLD